MYTLTSITIKVKNDPVESNILYFNVLTFKVKSLYPELVQSIEEDDHGISSSTENASLLIPNSKPDDDDTPRKLRLKRTIQSLKNSTIIKSKKIKLLKDTIRRQKKKIISLKHLVDVLNKKLLLHEDKTEILFDSFGKYFTKIHNTCIGIWKYIFFKTQCCLSIIDIN